jgi:hypothetical protein
MNKRNMRRHDSEYNDFEYKDTEHNGLFGDTENKWNSA